MKKIKGPIYFLGDTHSVADTDRVLLHSKITSATVIHVGDAGISNGFDVVAPYLDEFLQERDIKLKIIRGNHDCPHLFPRVYSPHLELLADYSVFEFEEVGAKALCVGGGISIDRCLSTNNFDYWPEEKTPPIEKEFKGIDIVLSHDCPSWVNNNTNDIWSWGNRFFPEKGDKESLIKDSLNQREVMDQIFESVKPNQWWHGHYHNSLYELNRDCHFQCLNIGAIHKFC